MNFKKEKIEKIDLSELGMFVNNEEHRGYFLSNAGTEHYKLLAYISTLYNNTILIDIGTNRGCSSLALSYNPNNTVESFDLYELKELSFLPNNINYNIDNILSNKYENMIKQSPFIMLDTYHDGIFEREFYEFLQSINWKGMLLLDDILLNRPMQEFWSDIKHEKYDISDIGHITGTGIVIF
jgi:hypothetical protein